MFSREIIPQALTFEQESYSLAALMGRPAIPPASAPSIGPQEHLLSLPHTRLQLHQTIGCTPANGDPHRTPDQLRILELHTCPLLTIVPQALPTLFGHACVQFLTQFTLLLILHLHRHHVDIKRRDGTGPTNAIIIVILLHSSSCDTSRPDTI